MALETWNYLYNYEPKQHPRNVLEVKMFIYLIGAELVPNSRSRYWPPVKVLRRALCISFPYPVTFVGQSMSLNIPAQLFLAILEYMWDQIDLLH